MRLPPRGVDAACRVLYGNRLAPCRLLVHFDSTEAREYVRHLAVRQRRTIELGENLHGEAQLAPSRHDAAVVGHRTHEIAAEQKHAAYRAVDDAFASFDGVEAFLFRHVYVE